MIFTLQILRRFLINDPQQIKAFLLRDLSLALDLPLPKEGAVETAQLKIINFVEQDDFLVVTVHFRCDPEKADENTIISELKDQEKSPNTPFRTGRVTQYCFPGSLIVVNDRYEMTAEDLNAKKSTLQSDKTTAKTNSNGLIRATFLGSNFQLFTEIFMAYDQICKGRIISATAVYRTLETKLNLETIARQLYVQANAACILPSAELNRQAQAGAAAAATAAGAASMDVNDDILYAASKLRAPNDPKKAAGFLESALMYSPFNAMLYVDLGYCLGATGQHEEAIQKFDAALELKVRFPKVYYLRGFSHARCDRYELAIQDIKEFLKYKPGNRDALLFLAVFYYKNKQNLEAIEVYTAMLKTRENILVRFNRACLSHLVQNYLVALQDIEAILDKLNKAGNDGHSFFEEFGMSSFLVYKVEPSEVIGVLLFIQGMCYEALGFPDKALASYNKGFEDKNLRNLKTRGRLLSNRAYLYQGLKEHAKASADIKDAVRMKEPNPLALRLHATQLLLKDEYSEALDLCLNALTIHEKHKKACENHLGLFDCELADLLTTIAKAHRGLGDPSNAQKFLSIAEKLKAGTYKSTREDTFAAEVALAAGNSLSKQFNTVAGTLAGSLLQPMPNEKMAGVSQAVSSLNEETIHLDLKLLFQSMYADDEASNSEYLRYFEETLPASSLYVKRDYLAISTYVLNLARLVSEHMPKNVFIFNKIARQYENISNNEIGMEYLKRSLAMDPTQIRANFVLGVWYMKRKDWNNAIKSFGKTKRQSLSYIVELAKCYRQLGLRTKELNCYSLLPAVPNAVFTRFQYSSTIYFKAKCYYDQKRYTAAYSQYRLILPFLKSPNSDFAKRILAESETCRLEIEAGSEEMYKRNFNISGADAHHSGALQKKDDQRKTKGALDDTSGSEFYICANAKANHRIIEAVATTVLAELSGESQDALSFSIGRVKNLLFRFVSTGKSKRNDGFAQFALDFKSLPARFVDFKRSLDKNQNLSYSLSTADLTLVIKGLLEQDKAGELNAQTLSGLILERSIEYKEWLDNKAKEEIANKNNAFLQELEKLSDNIFRDEYIQEYIQRVKALAVEIQALCMRNNDALLLPWAMKKESEKRKAHRSHNTERLKRVDIILKDLLNDYLEIDRLGRLFEEKKSLLYPKLKNLINEGKLAEAEKERTPLDEILNCLTKLYQKLRSQLPDELKSVKLFLEEEHAIILKNSSRKKKQTIAEEEASAAEAKALSEAQEKEKKEQTEAQDAWDAALIRAQQDREAWQQKRLKAKQARLFAERKENAEKAKAAASALRVEREAKAAKKFRARVERAAASRSFLKTAVLPSSLQAGRGDLDASAGGSATAGSATVGGAIAGGYPSSRPQRQLSRRAQRLERTTVKMLGYLPLRLSDPVVARELAQFTQRLAAIHYEESTSKNNAAKSAAAEAKETAETFEARKLKIIIARKTMLGIAGRFMEVVYRSKSRSVFPKNKARDFRNFIFGDTKLFPEVTDENIEFCHAQNALIKDMSLKIIRFFDCESVDDKDLSWEMITQRIQSPLLETILGTKSVAFEGLELVAYVKGLITLVDRLKLHQSELNATAKKAPSSSNANPTSEKAAFNPNANGGMAANANGAAAYASNSTSASSCASAGGEVRDALHFSSGVNGVYDRFSDDINMNIEQIEWAIYFVSGQISKRARSLPTRTAEERELRWKAMLFLEHGKAFRHGRAVGGGGESQEAFSLDNIEGLSAADASTMDAAQELCRALYFSNLGAGNRARSAVLESEAENPRLDFNNHGSNEGTAALADPRAVSVERIPEEAPRGDAAAPASGAASHVTKFV